MDIRAVSASIICLSLSVFLSAGTALEIKTPLLVWDIDFNDDPLDKPPRPMTKEQIESQQKDILAALPIKTYSKIEYLMPTRRALVKQEAAGLKDQAVLFIYEENAQPHYGPRMWCVVPWELAKMGKLWRLSFDVSKGNIAKSGGVTIWDITGIYFFEDGTVRAGTAEIARYSANRPLHVECIIDVPGKKATITVNGKSESSVTIPWAKPNTPFFSAVAFEGLIPGGHAEAPSSIAFDNIRLVMEESK
ncbi:MAG: hypothetical protein WAX69_23275 [Victivallales bacterium]